MIFKVRRDSCCMADDVNAPNELQLEFCDNTRIYDFMNKIIELKYLPEGYIWVLSDLNVNKEILAFYNNKNFFYNDTNIFIEQFNKMDLRFKIYNRQQRNTFISEEERKYAKSFKYKLYCLKDLIYVFIWLILIFCIFANAIFPLIYSIK